MARSYRPVQRDQAFLLPPDMREWLPEDHLVWLVLEIVEQLDRSALHARHPNAGAGRAAYDPDMLLALLIYAYCQGVRSSRQIEQRCVTDVAFRVLCAQDAPDHTTIARFRVEHQEAFARCSRRCCRSPRRPAWPGSAPSRSMARRSRRTRRWTPTATGSGWRVRSTGWLRRRRTVDAAEDAEHAQ